MNAKTARSTVAVLALALLLAACGNKGPLVMPQKPVPVQEPAAPPSATAPAEPPATPPVDADPKDPSSLPTEGGNG